MHTEQPHPSRHPRSCPTCPATAAGLERRAQRSRARHPRAPPRVRARSHPHSQLTHFKVHSQNSQTFPSPKERKSGTLPFPPKGSGPGAHSECATASISLPAPGGCDERGRQKGTYLGRRGGTAKGEGGARRGAAWFLLLGSRSFASISKTRRGKLFLHLTLAPKLPPPLGVVTSFSPSHPFLPKSDNPDRLTGSGGGDSVYPEKS